VGRAPDPQPVLLDPRYFENPKITTLTGAAQLLHLRSLAHANLHLTDGFVTHADAISLARAALTTGPLVEPTVTESLGLIDSLLAAGLWHHANEGGFEIHDYALYQQTRESLTRREQWRERKRRSRGESVTVTRDRHAGDVVLDVEVDVLERPSTSTQEPARVPGNLPVDWDELRDLVSGLRGCNDRTFAAVSRLLRGLPESALRSALEMARRPEVQNQAGYLVRALQNAREQTAA
jgi:hypothetical protein